MMCNMKSLLVNRSSAHEEVVENDAAIFHDVNVSEIGQTLAQMGDILNDKALRKCKYFRLAAIGIVLTCATIITLSRVA